MPPSPQSSPQAAKDMSEAQPESVFERTLGNLRSAWHEIAVGAARSIGLDRQSAASGDERALKAMMATCLEARGGEVSARLHAAELGETYLTLAPEGRRRFLEVLARDFGVDGEAAAAAILAYQEAAGEEDKLAAESRLRQALQPPRVKLLTQFNALPDGVKFLVDLRADLLAERGDDPHLAALEDDLRGLLTSWFDVGFLNLRPIRWDSPAALLEKLIAYEAVHEIRSWEDLRDRLDSDRRCYALFHPRMPDEPLAFVEIALVNGMADNVQQLLDHEAPASDPERANTAIFYSISNTQRGLSRISFGDYLIKRVVHQLSKDFPNLKTFATLSPVPGFRRWLEAIDEEVYGELLTNDAKKVIESLTDRKSLKAGLLDLAMQSDWEEDTKRRDIMRTAFQRLAIAYFRQRRDDGRPLDPVARFHLKNGARLERINWLADSSELGMKQAAGLMVNYRYVLADIEKNHEAYMKDGRLVLGIEPRALLRGLPAKYRK